MFYTCTTFKPNMTFAFDLTACRNLNTLHVHFFMNEIHTWPSFVKVFLYINQTNEFKRTDRLSLKCVASVTTDCCFLF